MSQTTISFALRVNGVLTNASSCVLRDPTAAFGVRRTDTLATVVAAATALTNQSTGIYSHTFTDPAEGLTYNYWVEWVYGGETFRVERNQSQAPAASASSYCTLSQANTIANALPGLASFKAATDDAKTAALLLASQDIDAAGPWQGRRYDMSTDQLLEFPRVAYESSFPGNSQGATGNSCADVVWDLDADGEAVVPAEVMRACVYQADAIIDGGLEETIESLWTAVASESVGSVSVSYRDPAAIAAALGASPLDGLCARAARMLKKYTLRTGRLL